MWLEKVVRPLETGQVTPPRYVIKAGDGSKETAGFTAGRGGSGKTFEGSFSETISSYVESYVNEKRV